MPPELFPDYVKSGPVKELPSGAQKQFISGHLRLWTAELAITIFADPSLAERVTDALSPLQPSFAHRPALSAPPGQACDKIRGRDRDSLPLPER